MTSAALTSTIWFPLTAHQLSESRGKKLFSIHCSGCHAVNPNESKLGPNLAQIGMVGGTRIAGMRAEEYIYRSIIDPSSFRASGQTGEMPAGFDYKLSPIETRDIVTYLVSQSAAPAYARIAKLQHMQEKHEHGNETISERLVLSNIEKGDMLFHDKFGCSDCHAIGEPIAGESLIAPNLGGIGFASRAVLKTAVRKPSFCI